jgi:hypothetical protein
MMSITRSSLLVLALTIATAFAGALQAAEAQPTFVSALQINVAFGRQAALEAYALKAIEANDQVGSDFYWTTTQTVIGDTTTYSFIRQVNSFAELEPPAQNAVVQAFGPADAAKLMDDLAPAVTAVRSGVWAHRPDLSRPPAERDTPATLLQTIILTTKPGTQREFEEYVGKIGEASRQLDSPLYWQLYSPVVGAGTDYGVVIPRWGYAELDTPPPQLPDLLEEAFGRREATRLLKIASETILEIDTSLSTIRLDLSRQPAADEGDMGGQSVTGD